LGKECGASSAVVELGQDLAATLSLEVPSSTRRRTSVSDFMRKLHGEAATVAGKPLGNPWEMRKPWENGWKMYTTFVCCELLGKAMVNHFILGYSGVHKFQTTYLVGKPCRFWYLNGCRSEKQARCLGTGYFDHEMAGC